MKTFEFIAINNKIKQFVESNSRINKIMQIMELNLRITKHHFVFLKFHSRFRKIIKNIRILLQNHKIFENIRIPFDK